VSTSNSVSRSITGSGSSNVEGRNALSAGLTQFTNIAGLASNVETPSTTLVNSLYNAYAANPSGTHILYTGIPILHENPEVPATNKFKLIQLLLETPYGQMTLPSGSLFDAYFPTSIQIIYLTREATNLNDLLANGLTRATITSDWQTQNISWSDVDADPGWYYLLLQPLGLYDLSSGQIVPTAYVSKPNGSGGGFTLLGNVSE
jgi:hypothetical protein